MLSVSVSFMFSGIELLLNEDAWATVVNTRGTLELATEGNRTRSLQDYSKPKLAALGYRARY